jgi:hypothetical protein
VLVLTLPGVTKVPLNPKGGKGFSKKRQASSDLTVAYDDDFRVFITSTKDCQDKVRTAHGVGAGLPLPPTCSQEAYKKNQSGRPAAGGATHFLYWPMVLLPIIIRPHFFYVLTACSCRY